MEEKKNDFLNRKTERTENIKEEPEKTNKKPKILDFKKNIVTKIQCIQSYKEEKMKEWNLMDKKKLDINDLKIFVKEKYDIHNDSQKLYMEYLIKNDKKEFIEHYSKYQFVLNLDTRKEIQNKIKDDKELMEISMIKNNIIPDDCISLRNILINILKNILKNFNNAKLHKESIDIDLKKIFIENHAYFSIPFDYLIPTKYSDNLEYKYNILIYEVIHFLFPWEQILEAKNITEEKTSIYEKILLFEFISIFLDKENMLNDDEIINRCDYIFNLFDIYFQVESFNRNLGLLKIILTTCIPFDINIAKNQLKIMKNFIISQLDINGSPLEKFDLENLKEDSEITLKNKTGKTITVKTKEINWYLGNHFFYYFNNNIFMICFTYETLLNKNYIKMKPMNEPFTELFKKMIKSDIIKEAILKDSEAVQFEYLFLNDDIINECLQSIYYVPFPVTGLYGYTDKSSFKTYIYSNLNVNSITSTLTEYDNIFKTKIHEFKHISRIYYHLFNIHISLGTPKTNKQKKNLISDNFQFMKNRIDEMKEVYKSKVFVIKN